jgi:hypothetical protein
VFCPTKRVLVRKLKSIPGQLRIPHVTHHCFENEDSQPTISHFDEDKTYIATVVANIPQSTQWTNIEIT